MGITDTITSATTATQSITSGVSDLVSGPVSAIGSAVSGVSGAVGALTGLLSGGGGGQSLPLTNPLFAYATYDYVITMYAITTDELANPDTTYMKGKIKGPIICATANILPTNRVKTTYGAFDFFINNLKIDSVMAMTNGYSTMPVNLSFDIIEPYSFGMFPLALQTAALKAIPDGGTWQSLPFLLKIEFRGNKETGTMGIIPNTTRYCPISLTNIRASVTGAGSQYQIEAYVYNHIAMTDQVNKVATDVSVRGKTIQEVLQTGDKSLQVTLNKREQEKVKQKLLDYPDQYIILFPEDSKSGNPSSTTNPGDSEDGSSATTNTSSGDSIGNLANTVGVSVVTIYNSNNEINNYEQNAGVNYIGKTSMGWSDDRKGDAPHGQESVVYDATNKIMRKDKNIVDPKTGEMKFSQQSTIENMINQVVLASDIPKTAMKAEGIDANGFRQWWKIELQTYIIDKPANKNGLKPKLYVYRVVPYDVHSSQGAATGSKGKFGNLPKELVKQYSYIYTGKNQDIIRFNLDFNASFAQIFLAGNTNSTDTRLASKESSSVNNEPEIANPVGSSADTGEGSNKVPTKNAGNKTKTDGGGGGSNDSPAVRAARQLHDVLTNGVDLINLNMEIIGDPYWIGHSGWGNYVAKPSKPNLNADGSVNSSTREVNVGIIFRTPTDINQSTGLYSFPNTKSAPVLGYSGIYKVTQVESNFRDGKFTQILTGYRLNTLEYPGSAAANSSFSLSNWVKDVFSDKTDKKQPDPAANPNEYATNDKGEGLV